MMNRRLEPNLENLLAEVVMAVADRAIGAYRELLDDDRLSMAVVVMRMLRLSHACVKCPWVTDFYHGLRP
jgi:hypothetical protein